MGQIRGKRVILVQRQGLNQCSEWTESVTHEISWEAWLSWARSFVGCAAKFRGWNSTSGSLNSHLLQAAAQSIGMEIERAGRTLVAFNYPVGLCQDIEDVLSLNLFQRS